MRSLLVLLAALLVLGAAADAPSVPLAAVSLPTPPMGVNDWNATGCTDAFDEAWVHAQADALVSTGLRDVGYRYVDLDDCWAAPQRVAGRLVADPVRFPHGIAALADYVHARGLRLGLYTSAGTMTCDPRGFPASLGHETADAASFAAWGVDYVKEDDCFTAGTDAVARYTAMATALRVTGRPIVFAVCDKGNSAPWRWAPGIAQVWRTTHDVADDWDSVADIVRLTTAVPWARGNDPDMLEVGNPGLTPTEQATQLAVWSMLGAPLLAGTDLAAAARADPATIALLGDRDLVGIDQDPAWSAPTVTWDGDRLMLRRVLTGGRTAVSVTALGDAPEVVPAGVVGRDVVAGGAVASGTVVAPHATVVVVG
ncbi:glycoside hydrolase family 27 protein [Actinomycetospora sp. CA-084318]|uniref:glycoside hydrolase family 27 protein n=1 Tax=Actinomycetospora sp. CA-084318 TaxID=3239892 RepID=UPI003D962BAE